MGMIPLQFPAAERFDALRRRLEEWGYMESALCERMKFPELCAFRPPDPGNELGPLNDATDVLCGLFLDHAPVARNLVSKWLGDGMGLLEEFGLLRTDPRDAEASLGTVMLYPTQGMFIASDRGWEPGSDKAEMFSADVVFSAITPNTYQFVNSLPNTPCGRLLDLCAGSGVAGLLAASTYAKSAWLCDITERSTRFAEWNARLNGTKNVTTLQGDLYEPVKGEKFDRIVAHPPYVPATEIKYVFRDGGEDGEQVTRRIIEGLPEYLAPGGQCFLVAAVTDRAGAPFEQRVRQMLGKSAGEFDVFVAVRNHCKPTEFLIKEHPNRDRPEELAANVAAMTRLGVEHILYCSTGIQRRASKRDVFTVRRQVTVFPGELMAWAVRWETAQREPGFAKTLFRTSPRIIEQLRLQVTHRIQDGKWTIADSKLLTGYPYQTAVDCPSWVVNMMEECDGTRTVRALLNECRENGTVPSNAPDAEFARFVQFLISMGLLEIEEHRLPKRR